MFPAPTEVCVKDNPEFRTRYEERRDQSPYLGGQLYERLFDEDYIVEGYEARVGEDGEGESGGSNGPTLHQHQHRHVGWWSEGGRST